MTLEMLLSLEQGIDETTPEATINEIGELFTKHKYEIFRLNTLVSNYQNLVEFMAKEKNRLSKMGDFAASALYLEKLEAFVAENMDYVQAYVEVELEE